MQDLSQMNSSFLEDMRKAACSLVGQRRYEHILRVEKEIIRLSEVFLPDKLLDLRISAILHDITKDLSLKQQLQLCKKFDIIVSEHIAYEVLHAKTGAYYAKELFPSYVNEEVFNAIKNHTTGSVGMTLFDKLLFVADYIEEGRKYQKCLEVREKLWFGVKSLKTQSEREMLLDMICVEILDNTIEFLMREKRPIDEETVVARNELVCKIG